MHTATSHAMVVLIAGSLASALFDIAVAQEPLEVADSAVIEEIIVTARFREERLQDIGASVSAYGGESMEAAGMRDFEDIARRTAGLNLLDRGPNQNEVSIRGVANELPPQTADGGNVRPLVTQYFDDVQFASPTAAQRDMNLFDLDRVEVLKGPQPTYFGEGSMGGTVRYFSRNPTLSGDAPVSGRLNANYESISGGGSGYRVQGVLDLTLAPDVFGVRVMGFYRDDGGFIDNPVTGDNNANGFESKGGRLVALWQPVERFSGRLTAHIQRDEPEETHQIDAGNAPDELTFSPSIPGVRADDFDLYALNLTYEFDPLAVTSITSYRERSTLRDTFDAGNSGALSFLYGTSTTVFSLVALEEEKFSQEFRFVSNLDGPLNFTAGFLYEDGERDNFVDVTSSELSALLDDPTGLLPGESVFFQQLTFEDSTESAFVEFTFSATEAVRLIAGVRYFNQELVGDLAANPSLVPQPDPVTFLPFVTPILVNDNVQTLIAAGIGPEQSFKLDEWLPRFAVEFDIDDDLMVYASVSEGARNGGFNSPLSAIGAPQGFEEAVKFEPDFLTSYEIGLKSVLLDGSLVFNAALYRNEFKDPQTQIIPVTTQLYANGPDLEVTGVEIDSTFRFNENWGGYVAASWSDGEFEDDFDLGGAGTIASGNSPSGLPELQFALGVDFRYAIGTTANLDLFGRLDFQYTDDRFTSPQNFELSKIGSLEILNVRLGVGNDRWTLAAYLDNALDDIEYQLLGLAVGGVAVVTSYVNRPQTVGLALDVNF